MADTVGEVLTDALLEIRVARAGDAVNPNTMDMALRRLNLLLDEWLVEDRSLPVAKVAAVGDPAAWPDGYQAAITLSLAVGLASWFGQRPSDDLIARARHATDLVMGRNDAPPRIATADSGLSRSGSTVFDWRTRER